jgi:hypothetical protein
MNPVCSAIPLQLTVADCDGDALVEALQGHGVRLANGYRGAHWSMHSEPQRVAGGRMGIPGASVEVTVKRPSHLGPERAGPRPSAFNHYYRYPGGQFSTNFNGMWRSLAARLLWEQEVRGSNPRIPTTCG